jgi:hypothetical protein
MGHWFYIALIGISCALLIAAVIMLLRRRDTEMPESFKLESLFRGLHDSVSKATDVARDRGIEDLRQDFFEPDENGKLSPKVINVILPHMEGGKLVEREFNIPLYALAKHQSLVIDELKINMHMGLHCACDDEPEVLARLSSKDVSSGCGCSSAEVEIVFRGTAPPEGVLRINDQLVKTLP